MVSPHPTDPITPDERTPVRLLIDVGGTNIKHMITSCAGPDSFLESLQATPPQAPTRIPWAEHQLEKALVGIIESAGPVDQIQLAITDHPNGNRRKYCGYLREKGSLPQNLAERMEQVAVLPRGCATIFHDTKAWASGYQYYLSAQPDIQRSSRGLLVVGTGISFASIAGETLEHPELSSLRYDWTALRDKGGWGEAKRAPHNHLAKRFFNWLDQQAWSDERKACEIATRSEILLRGLAAEHGLTHFVFAGGLAPRFNGLASDDQIEVLSEESLGFHPNFLPMLGMLRFACDAES